MVILTNFYSTFYSNFVVNASDCLNMENPMATLVTKRLADKLLYHAKGPTELPQEQPAIISCRELSGLQYLARYVVHKFMKKAKYNMKYNNNNQEIIALLQTFVSEDWSEKKLIPSQNRGGLTTVNNDIEKKLSH